MDSEGKDINIYHLTDTHDGADGCDTRLLKDVIRKIELDPCAFWTHGGDIIDPDRPSMRERKSGISHDRPEALTHEDEKTMLWLEKKMFPKWKPIAHKCIGVIAGDHYCRFSNNTNSAQHLCTTLKMPYLGERLGYTSLLFTDSAEHAYWYDVLVRHGKGSASTPGGDVAALLRQSSQWIADVNFGGHTHKENCHPVPLMRPNATRTALRQRICWHVRGGSFLRGYLEGKTSYVEQAEYNPLCIGWAEVHVKIGYTNQDGFGVVHSSAELHAA